jgi:teichoic acid transport system permease protein
MSDSTDRAEETDDEPTELGAADTVEFRRDRKAERAARRESARQRNRVQKETGIVTVYEPHVRYVPPLKPYLRSLWERRTFMLALAQSKVRSSRAQTVLGPIWALLDPMFQVAIYFFLFTVIRGGSRPPEFLPMLIFGILHFQISTSALNEGGNSVTGGKQLMLNSTFPRALLPLAAILGGALKFLPAIPVLLGTLLLLEAVVSLQLLWWPVLLMIQILIGVAMALLVSTLVVFFRDVKNLLTYVSRIMFFTTPVIYPASVIPPGIETYIRWGPLYGVFANYQRMVTGADIDYELLAISVGWAVLGTLFGGWIFLRFEREFGRKI